MMTPRERVMATLRREPTDKIAFTVYENKLPQCSVERRLRNEGLCIVHRNCLVHQAETPNCVTESFRYTENGESRTRTVTRTPVGEVSVVTQPAGFTTWTIEHLFKRPEDYAALLYMIKDTRYKACYAGFAAAEKLFGDDVIMRAGVGSIPLHQIMIHWMGIETFSMEWAENRDEILKLEAAMREKLREAYPIVAASPITHANFGGNEVPGVMGVQRYKEYCVPLINECAAEFHKHGKWLGSHMDGNNAPWKHLVRDSGLDYVEAFTPTPDTDMTLKEALEAWPDKVIWMNFPSSVHLSKIEKIKQTARGIIETARGTNRVILGITEDVPEDRWQENFLVISEVINEMAWGK